MHTKIHTHLPLLYQKVLQSCFHLLQVRKTVQKTILLWNFDLCQKCLASYNYALNISCWIATREFIRLESKWLGVLTHNAVNWHHQYFLVQSLPEHPHLQAAVWGCIFFLWVSKRPLHQCGEGGRDVSCSAACWLIMGRELLLGWPGRVLEPVGLAQGGLATDPGGDGMKSGTSQNTSPGFGAFLAFPPPMAACPCVYVYETENKGRKCVRKATRTHVHKDMCACFTSLAVWIVRLSSKTRQHHCRTHPNRKNHYIWAQSETGSFVVMKVLTLNHSLAHS